MTDDVDKMTEAQLAEYFQRHRDDLAGDEVDSRPPARLDVMISIRFTREEAAVLRTAAEHAGMSLSAYLRQTALAASATNVVDLDRVRRDVARVRELASDALRALA
ncbi:MAG TPA: hypothetical protein VFB84_12115 [Micromonosporaceae bacterium]|nr:hypothetical protein [Micromonosporaceae bacterium]